MARPRAHDPVAQRLIAELVERHHPDLVAAVAAATAAIGKRVDKATALRYHAEHYPEGGAASAPAPSAGAPAVALPASAEPTDQSELARLLELRDQAARTARLAIEQRDPRLSLAATREAMRATMDIERLRDRLQARAAASQQKRQVVLYLPERRTPQPRPAAAPEPPA